MQNFSLLFVLFYEIKKTQIDFEHVVNGEDLIFSNTPRKSPDYISFYILRTDLHLNIPKLC